MASAVALISEGSTAATKPTDNSNGPTQQQPAPASVPAADMSKPMRAPPKVFASPKKRVEKKPEPRQPMSKQAIKAKLRKALAPYLTSSYLQSEMAKRFTKEYMAANPPPENEDDLPGYIQAHFEELERVTERWSGCVGRALDPLTHEMAVEGRLQRLRARDEGLSVEPPFGGAPGKRQGGVIDEFDDDDLDFGLGAGAGGNDDGLTSAQIFGAVHLVSDVKVWQQILAAQRAEERRQHAIAELHINHAAKIIQRSWHDFITRKKEEQARLDALVSPDVQAMLSAAAYKAMRDARNKLAILKLRKSLSRKARGFNSTAARDLDPIPRTAGGGLQGAGSGLQGLGSGLQAALSGTQPVSPRRRGRDSRSTVPGARRSVGSVVLPSAGNSGFGGFGAAGGSGDGDGSGGDADAAANSTDAEGGGSGSRSTSPIRARSSGAITKSKSFAARSARIVTRLVSIKEPLESEAAAAAVAEAEAEGGGDASDAGGGRQRQAQRSRARGARGAPPRKRPSGAAADGVDAAEGGEDGDGGVGDRAEGEDGQGEGGGRWDGGEDGEEDEDEDGFGLGPEDLDSDSECASGSEEDEEQSAEAAMAEAEEVVQVAAELAKSFMRPGGGAGAGAGEDEEEGDEDAGEDGIIGQMGDEALRALTSVELAADAVGTLNGRASSLVPLAPPPLRTAMAAAAAAFGSDGDAAAAAARRAAAAVHVGPHRGQSLEWTQDAAVIRQLIAGALAAAAAPVLGRKKALAVAQMGLGELLQLPGAKGMLPQAAAAAARMRPAPGPKNGQLAATGKAVGGAAAGGHSGPFPPQALEGRAGVGTAVMPGGGKSGARLSGSEGGGAAAAGVSAHGRAAWTSGRKSLAGEGLVDGGGANASPRRQPRLSQGTGSGGAVTLPLVHPGGAASSLASDIAVEAADASAAVFRHSHATSVGSGLFGGGGSGSVAHGGPYGYPTRVSPTGVSAAAAASMATQPWASPRRIRHPPGAHTMAGSIPDLRGAAAGGGGGFTRDRDTSWLLPPIGGFTRSSTGPAVLGTGYSGAATGSPSGPTAAVAAAAAAANGIIRTGSDPTLQRPLAGGGVGGGGVSAGGGGAGGPGAMAAAAAAAAVGRARRCSVVGGGAAEGGGGALPSPEGGSPLVVQLSGFMINGLSPAGPSQVAQRVRLSSLMASSEGAVQQQQQQQQGLMSPLTPTQQQQQQQPVPLPSALAGGGGGAGGGTAAARLAVAAANGRTV